MEQEKIGKYIAKLRKERKMTQEDLAEKLGINSKSISRWENGKCMPDLSLIVPLSEELGVTVNDLLSGEKVDKNDYQGTFEKNILNLVNKVEGTNKNFKKIFKALLIILIVMPILGTIFCFIDYKRVKNENAPIFSKGVGTYHVEICDPDSEDCFTNNRTPVNKVSTIYYGFGYRIVTCNYCQKSIYIMPFGIGTYPTEDLTCKDNDTTYHYSFMDGKVRSISTTFIIPIKDIINKETYENEINELNNIKGCYSTFTKTHDLNYTLNKSCDLSIMLEKDIMAEYGSDSYKLKLTKKEIVKDYKKNNKSVKCN